MKDNREIEWLHLDNAALIYPAAMNHNWTALFRLSAELNEDIDPITLQSALDHVLPRFPAFSTRLRRGLFWYYLENADRCSLIQRDVANPCVRMDLRRNGGLMFRVRYYGRRVAVEIFHVLTDGTGGLCFLKTLVAEYLRLRYGASIPCDAQILNPVEAPKPDELEDSFVRFARGACLSRKESIAYPIRGTSTPHFMHIITGTLPIQSVKDVAAAYQASVNEFLTAVLLCSIAEVQSRDRIKSRRKLPVKVNVPVNLRRFYPSVTMRNFASYVNVGFEPLYGAYSFEETVRIVHSFMGLELTEKRLNARFSTNVRSTQNPFVRFLPLPLKLFAMKLAYSFVGDRYSSSSLSNLGLTRLPDEMAKYVTRLDFMLGPLQLNPVTCACLSYGESMNINFTRTIMEAEVERAFFTRLVKMGIPVKIESNERY